MKERVRDMAVVLFGRGLLGPSHESLRGKILMLAEERLTRPLYANTLLSVDACPPSDSLTVRCRWVLLFDFHRLFLYDDPSCSDAPGFESVVRFIMDDYPIKPIGASTIAAEQYPFKFFYSLDALDLLADLLAYDRPGTVVTLDMLTAEVRTSEAQAHPHAQTPRPEVVPAGLLPRSLGEKLVLANGIGGAGWRADGMPRAEGLVSPDVGIIRAEQEVVSETFLPGAVARLSWRRGIGSDICGGISFRAEEAAMVARFEALERYNIAYPRHDEPLVYGSYEELGDAAVDPLSLFFRVTGPNPNGPRTAYDNSSIKYVTYYPSTPTYWTGAHDPLTGEELMVPAQEVWFNTDLLPEAHNFVNSSTNGCALGGCVEEAALFAILEAVERDAYLTMWYLRRRCKQIAADSVRFEPFRLLWERLKTTFPNYRIHLFDTTTDVNIPAVAAVAVREWGEGPRTLHAGAARPLVESALFTAIKDLSAALRHDAQLYEPQRYREAIERPELIDRPEDHRAFFALDETFERLSFMDFQSAPRMDPREINERSPIPAQTSYRLGWVVEKIAEHLNERGIRVLLKDITHPTLAGRNFRCVRAVTPGLYPLWFGHNCARFSVTDRLKMLGRHFTGRAFTTETDFNLDVHPFS